MDGSLGKWTSPARRRTPITYSGGGVSPPIATNLAISKGDYVGIRNLGTSDRLGEIDNGAIQDTWLPAGYGNPSGMWLWGSGPGEIEVGNRALLQGPQAEGEEPKGARKALTAADCKIGKLKETKKVRDRKEVVSQSLKPGTAVSDTYPIFLGLSRKES